jgi:hypothetical protein
LDKLIEIRDGRDYRYLAIITGSRTSFSITYIVFVTEMQKGQIPEKKICPIEI